MRKTILAAALITFVAATGWASDAEARHNAKYGRPYPATEKKIEQARRAQKQQQENAKKKQDKQEKQEQQRSDVENN